jgi:hypothetical protein
MKISYRPLLAITVSASAAIAQSQPVNPSVPSNPSIQSKTAGGSPQTTIVDQNGSLKVVTPGANPAPATTPSILGNSVVPQMPAKDAPTTPASTNMTNPNPMANVPTNPMTPTTPTPAAPVAPTTMPQN